MTITEPQARALANLLHELRPDWPAKSLHTLIGKNLDSNFPALCTTAVTVATDSRNQTPAVIFLELARQAAGKPTSGPWTKEFHKPLVPAAYAWANR
jgi:hypothetical protein